MKPLHILIFLLFLSLSSCTLVQHASHVKLHKGNSKVYDAIIVPGFPYYANSDNSILKMRILWAKKLYDMGVTQHIIFTGSAVSTAYNEAEVMKQIAISLGVPEEVIYTEKEAEHSTENIYFAMQMCHKYRFSKVALATDFMQTAFLKEYINTYFPYLERMPIQFANIDMRTDIRSIDVEDCKVPTFVHLKDRKSKEEIRYASQGNEIDTTGYYILNADFTASLSK